MRLDECPHEIIKGGPNLIVEVNIPKYGVREMSYDTFKMYGSFDVDQLLFVSKELDEPTESNLDEYEERRYRSEE